MNKLPQTMHLYCGPSSMDAHFGQLATINNQIENFLFLLYLFIFFHRPKCIKLPD
jgi:hypothetical protein